MQQQYKYHHASRASYSSIHLRVRCASDTSNNWYAVFASSPGCFRVSDEAVTQGEMKKRENGAKVVTMSEIKTTRYKQGGGIFS